MHTYMYTLHDDYYIILYQFILYHIMQCYNISATASVGAAAPASVALRTRLSLSLSIE